MGSRTQLYSLVALGAVLLSVCFLGPVLATFPTPALGAVVVYAATRLVDVRRAAPARPVPAQRAGPGAGHHGLGAGASTCCTAWWSRSRCRSWTCCAGSSKPHDGVLGYVPGLAGMHDVDDYPVEPPGARAGGLPLRLAAVLRQRRELPAPGPGRGGRGRPAGRWFLLNAEANVEVDLTGGRRPGGAAADPGRSRHRLRHGAGQAGAARRAAGRRRLPEPRSGEDQVFMTLPTAVDAFTRWSAPPPPTADRKA